MDKCRVTLEAGTGGCGSGSFARTKQCPRGKPDGGNGGRGGSIVLALDRSVNNFSHLKTYYRAENGANGSANGSYGRCGQDLVIPVPAGTTFLNTEQPSKAHDVTGTVVVAEGGAGGRGNKALHTNNHVREPGQPGQRFIFELNLHTLADFSLIGLPNAGKSSLLAALTEARPKIASYPFTTLTPNVAVLSKSLLLQAPIPPTIADIPGLLEGAHRNIGLGHEFLKHILKSKRLILVVDISNPDPAHDVRMLVNELELYKTGLSKKIALILANKIDRAGHNLALKTSALTSLLPHLPVIPMSIRDRTNLDTVVQHLLSIEDKA